jgi:hypothetical protein
LRLDAGDDPDDPYTLFNLGWTLLDVGQPGEVAKAGLTKQVEKKTPPEAFVVACLHTGIH